MIEARRSALYLALLAAVALAGCARTAPPAPVVAGVPQATAAAAAPRPGVPQPQVPHPDAVIVQPGETLYGVARRYDVPVRSLIEANGLEPPYRLNAGRRLALPQLRQHIVQPGDTLYSISRLYGVDTSTLARRNGLEPPYRVRVGQSLILPAPVETAGGPPPVIQATAPAARFAAPAAPAAPPPTAAPVAATPLAPPAQSPPSEPHRLVAAPAQRNGEEQTAALPPPPPRAPPAPAPAAAPAASSPPAAAPPEAIAALPPPAVAPTPPGERSFIWPVHGRVIASYGNGPGGTHNDGINIAAPAGTPVVAADAGTVAYAGNELRGYGNLVLIKHANGWLTAYAHNSVLLVKRGETVRRGQTIARVGATGAVGEPQLHFEIRHGTRALDPGDYLPPEAATASRTQ